MMEGEVFGTTGDGLPVQRFAISGGGLTAPALTADVALARIAKAAGSQLDPVPAMIFVKAMRAQAAREAREAVSRQSAAGVAPRRARQARRPHGARAE